MQTNGERVRERPRVSVVMANFEAGEKIVPALRSVLDQSMGDLEVIVSDDASRDDSLALVRAMMETDARIRLMVNSANRGPAYCRNVALDTARGEWVAVVDADDIIHPERFERLLALADHTGASIVADDLLLFHDDGSPPRLMLGEETRGSFVVTPEDWVVSGLDGSPSLGYLKPMIRAAELNQLRYDEGLRIGEDYDLVLRLLMSGAHMVVAAEPFYLYRRHSGSISHRLSVPDMRAMLDRQATFTQVHSPTSAKLAQAFDRRMAALKSGLAYEALVDSVKGRQLTAAMRLLVENPRHLQRLWLSFVEGRRRGFGGGASLRKGPDLIRLGARDTSGADHVVPDYVPAHQVDWTAPRHNLVWQGLASHANGRCIALDKAGQYAAGFIPQVTLETGAAPS